MHYISTSISFKLQHGESQQGQRWSNSNGRPHQPQGCQPGCLRPQLGEGSQGHCPSQASIGSSHKGDGKGSCAHQALLNETSEAVIPTILKVTSGASGFKVMDPFDWSKDKAIYHRWQMWSEKARHALDAMEGDSEKTKISYFHHWIDGEGMGKIEH